MAPNPKVTQTQEGRSTSSGHQTLAQRHQKRLRDRYLHHGLGESESRSVVSDSATPWTIQSMEFSRPVYWSGQPFPSPGDLPNPRIKARSPALQADSLPAEPHGKPKNTGVGSVSLLQGIFPTQESNWGALQADSLPQKAHYSEVGNQITPCPLEKSDHLIRRVEWPEVHLDDNTDFYIQSFIFPAFRSHLLDLTPISSLLPCCPACGIFIP